jgi:hypothetical protein
MIERRILSNILAALQYFPAVAILGARQTGKNNLVEND